MNTDKKLYRSRSNRILFGVCGGLGEYMNIDPTVVRAIFAVGALIGFGSFIFIYLVLMLIMPDDPRYVPPAPPAPPVQ